jgi:hypothetical protein
LSDKDVTAGQAADAEPAAAGLDVRLAQELIAEAEAEGGVAGRPERVAGRHHPRGAADLRQQHQSHLTNMCPSHIPRPELATPAKIERASAYDKIEHRLRGVPGTVARLARALVAHARRLTSDIDELAAEITALVQRPVPSLLDLWLRCADRSEDPGRDRRCRPVPVQGRLRPPHRHPTAAGVVLQPSAPSSVPRRRLNAALHASR